MQKPTNEFAGLQSAARRTLAAIALSLFAVPLCVVPGSAADAGNGQAILEKNCGRCHGVAAGAASPLKQAPNLWAVLSNYPGERLELELSEGLGSRHENMPQIQFSSEDIESIYDYLHPRND